MLRFLPVLLKESCSNWPCPVRAAELLNFYFSQSSPAPSGGRATYHHWVALPRSPLRTVPASIMSSNVTVWCGRPAGYAKDTKHKDNKAAKQSLAKSQPADTVPFDLDEYRRNMEGAVEHLSHELSGVRTGRANPGLIEPILVEAYGEKVPVRACGAVTVRNSQTLAVAVYDPQLVTQVQKAIATSALKLNPSVEGQEVIVPLPRQTQDTVEKMVRLVAQEAEGARGSIRHTRHKALDVLKKFALTADEQRLMQKEVQKLHDEFIAEVDRVKHAKEKELRDSH